MSRIDPSGLPVLQPEQAEASANFLRTMGQAVESHATNAFTEWQGLILCYQAPEGAYVNLLFKPVVATGQEVNAALGSAASVMDDYAAELADVKTRLEALRAEAEAFVEETEGAAYLNVRPFGRTKAPIYLNLPLIVHGWDQWPPTVEQNNQLLAKAAAIMADLSELEASFGQQIVSLLSPGRRPTAKGASVFPAYNADQFLNSPVPWGEPQKRQYTSFLDNAYSTTHDWVGNTISSIAGLAGVKWDWPPSLSPSLARDTWQGVGMFALGCGIAQYPGVVASAQLQYQLTGDKGDFGTRSATLAVTAIGGIVGYDYQAQLDGEDPWRQWKDDPQATATNTVFNIVSLNSGVNNAGPKLTPWNVATNVAPLIPDPDPGRTATGRPTVPLPEPPEEPSTAPAPITGTTSTTAPPDVEDHSDPGTLGTPPPQGGPTAGTTVPKATTSTTVPAG